MRRLLLYTILFLAPSLLAQQSNTLYYMYRAPQASFLNPARQYPCQFYMSVPLLSSIHVNYGNTAFSINSISDVTGDSMQFNTAKILKNVHNLDHISTELHYTLLSFGFKKFEYYFSFSLTEKNEFYLSLPNDIFGLALQGNGPFLDKDKPIKLNRLGVNLFHYREWAFAVSKEFSDELQIGMRAKFLFGKANINTRRSDIQYYTDPNSFEPSISSDSKINISAPVTITTNSDGYISGAELDPSVSPTRMIMNGRNPGLALDGGFFYQYDDNITLSGSFNDLGFIWWRDHVTNATQNGVFNYTGLTDTSASASNIFMNLFDTVRTSFAPAMTNKSYVTMLPLKLYGGAEYRINNTFRAGILGRLWMYQYRLHPSVILHGSATLTRFLTLNVNWAYNNYSFANLGAGVTFQTRNIQFYALTDNYSGLIWYKTARNLNARFGMNLFFGCNTKSKGKSHSGHKVGGGAKCAGCYWYRVMEEKRHYRK